MELFSPNTIEFVDFLVLCNAKLGEIADETLGSLGIFLCLQSIILDLLLAIFLALVGMRLLLNLGREDGRRRQDFIEVLELLSGLLLVGVGDLLLVDFGHVGEPIDNEGSKKHCIRYLVALDGKGCEALEGLQLGNLNETIDIIVLEKQFLEVDESLQLRDVRGTDDGVESNVLEGDLDDCLLEILVVEDLQGISINEQQLVTLDFSVT